MVEQERGAWCSFYLPDFSHRASLSGNEPTSSLATQTSDVKRRRQDALCAPSMTTPVGHRKFDVRTAFAGLLPKRPDQLLSVSFSEQWLLLLAIQVPISHDL